MATKPKGKPKRTAVMTRYTIIVVLVLGLSAWIGYNLFKNTVVHASNWNEVAARELGRKSKVILPERGDILAADGQVLATTMQYYDLRMDFGSEGFKWKCYVDDLVPLADSLEVYFPEQRGKKGWFERLREPLLRKKAPRGWLLLRLVTHADYQKVCKLPFFKGRKVGYTGLIAESSMRRRQPFGSMARLSIGVVSQDSATGQVHGMSGLEYALDSLLFGKPGVNKLVNFNRGIGQWADTAAVRGWDVVSTIDIRMQDILETALLTRLQETRAEWGTAVLMHVPTGEIKAISNLEEYPLGSGSGKYVEAMNRAVRRFEPGSVVKPLSMMIAIDDGVVQNLDSVIEIGASFRAFGQGQPITDSHYNSQLTVAGVIEQSSNIGMAKIMSRYYRDPQAYHDRVAKLGFLQRLRSGIGEEMAPWFPVVPLGSGGLTTLSRQFYGYAAEIPPLHTLSIYNAMANGGRYVRPRLVKELRREGIDSVVPVSYINEHVCSEATAKKMQALLSLVVESEHGTARALKNPYVKLAGKTGTCYTVNPETRKYDTSRKRLAFCGFFPADNPEYSCVVLMYHPREAAFGAATTSGVVLKNTAISMYSRGMLGNYKGDYSRSAQEPAPTAPMLFASRDQRLSEAFAQFYNKTPRQMSSAKAPQGSKMPNVVGMGLREAINALEARGLDVSFTGSGHVAAQTRNGNKVHLTLRN